MEHQCGGLELSLVYSRLEKSISHLRPRFKLSKVEGVTPSYFFTNAKQTLHYLGAFVGAVFIVDVVIIGIHDY